ncbi:MAG: dihydroneopterin aldolase [Flavobacteriaceae bacterium]|nr:dihydroneopterin aldolase [Flavobacteriaceae bacterium]
MGTIRLHTIQLYAFHGCLKEERKIGSEYTVDVSLSADLQSASNTDRLLDTLDYVQVHRIVQEEMKIPSDLLEHVAGRILKRLFKELLQLESATATVAKVNPPIMGDVASVSVTLTKSR